MGIKGRGTVNTRSKNVQLILDRTRKFQAPPIVEPAEEPFTVQAMLDLLATTRQNLLAFCKQSRNPKH